MNQNAASIRATRLKGLMPKMTDEQVLDVARRFIHLDESLADATIDRYTKKHQEYVLATFAAEINAGEGGALSQRIDHERARRQQERDEYKSREVEIDRIVESITDFAPYVEKFRAEHPLANNHPRGPLKPIDPMTSGFFRAWLHAEWKAGRIQIGAMT